MSLLAVEGGRLTRDQLYGDLAPWELDARSVSLEVTMLAVLGLIQLDPLNRSAPCLTTRGRNVIRRARDRDVTDPAPSSYPR